MKLYENVVIGNFLYGLGFAIGHRVQGDVFPSIVNLLQQTPDDVALGDLLFEAPGMLWVFEFKLRENTDGQKKEEKRHAELKAQLDLLPELYNVSREVHWYIETDVTKDHKIGTKQNFVSCIEPYIDAFPRGDNESERDFAGFINQVASETVTPTASATQAEMKAYLAMLAVLHTDGVRSGGLVVKILPDGTLHYADLVSVTELYLSREKMIEMRQELSVQREQGRQKSLERDRGHELG